MRVNKYLTPLPLGGLGWALSFWDGLCGLYPFGRAWTGFISREGKSLPLGGVGEGFILLGSRRGVSWCDIV